MNVRRALAVIVMSLAAHLSLPQQVEAKRVSCMMCAPWCSPEPAVECLFGCGFQDRYTAICAWQPPFCYGQVTIFCTPTNDQ